MLDTIHYTLGDCIEGMKQFPDGFFDLAVVDPPYGDAGGVWSGKERFGGRFDRYRSPVQPLRNVVRPVQESLSGSTTAADRKDIQFCGGGTTSPEPEEPGRQSTVKKLLRGTRPQEKSISTSFSVSHATKSFGAAITSTSRRRDVSLYGASCPFRKISLWQCASMPGRRSTTTQSGLNARRKAARTTNAYTRRRSPSGSTSGFWTNTRSQGTKSSTRWSAADRPLSRVRAWASRRGVLKSTRTITECQQKG